MEQQIASILQENFNHRFAFAVSSENSKHGKAQKVQLNKMMLLTLHLAIQYILSTLQMEHYHSKIPPTWAAFLQHCKTRVLPLREQLTVPALTLTLCWLHSIPALDWPKRVLKNVTVFHLFKVLELTRHWNRWITMPEQRGELNGQKGMMAIDCNTFYLLLRLFQLKNENKLLFLFFNHNVKRQISKIWMAGYIWQFCGIFCARYSHHYEYLSKSVKTGKTANL